MFTITSQSNPEMFFEILTSNSWVNREPYYGGCFYTSKDGKYSLDKYYPSDTLESQHFYANEGCGGIIRSN